MPCVGELYTMQNNEWIVPDLGSSGVWLRRASHRSDCVVWILVGALDRQEPCGSPP